MASSGLMRRGCAEAAWFDPDRASLARGGASSCGSCCTSDEPVRALGALPATRRCRWSAPALQAIYLSGWQVAADSNVAGSMYPDQSLYPANSGPELAKKINKTFQRADQIEHLEGGSPQRDWFAPIVADAEAGFGGPLELLRDHEGLYRGRRRGRSLRRPARVREEVRPPRRQGADPYPGGDPQPRCRAPCRRRVRRADDPRRAHRRRKRQAHNLRRR